ncbi:MAG: ATP-binding protein [Proteobacteria bacterium]|nr:ATP-binding protein [Pseudomonadota bacterium]
MKRDLLRNLEAWKSHPLRLPLILRGARQVGKSWLIKEFGNQFKHYVALNFEKDKDACTLFPESIQIESIVQQIGYYSGQVIEPGKTLLFLDEIQECPNALRALRYFKEDLPQLHVIAAGSLLDFMIEKLGLPVGRVQFLYLYPLSFAEFLTALGREDLREMLMSAFPQAAIHKQLLEMVKLYSLIGGMPAVVSAWLQYENALYCQEVQDAIINTYRQDFNKYAHSNQIEYVSLLFDKIPDQLGKKFIYTHVDEHITFYHLKQAMRLLHKAGIVYFCYHSAAQGIPLGAGKNLKKFKIFFFDIGLAQRILGVKLQDWVVQPLLPQHDGSIAEQFVAQEFIAYGSPSAPAELYYWHREAKSSNAEVDFIVTKRGSIIPVEVKSGKSGHVKSLQIFLESHPCSADPIIISTAEYQLSHYRYQQIPCFGIEAWFKK